MDNSSWLDTVTGWASKGVDAVINKTVNQPYELKRMQMAYGYGGYGYPGYGPDGAVLPGTPYGSGSGMGNMLVLGLGVLAIVLLVKD